jgi:hypothetical protein
MAGPPEYQGLARTDLSFEQRLADLNSNAPLSRALNGPYELNKENRVR